MGAGGIIQHHAKILLIAVTDTSMYRELSPGTKAIVDSIDAKDPMTRTHSDIERLLAALSEACGC